MLRALSQKSESETTVGCSLQARPRRPTCPLGRDLLLVLEWTPRNMTGAQRSARVQA